MFRAKKRITGEVRYHEDFSSNLLKHRRTIIVWLPPGYDNEPAKRYPVLYAHDGQNLFDPATAFAGVDWRLDETATRLIKRGRIAPIIIVGLYNTPARLEEYADTPVGRNFMKLLVEEVKPFIDQTYRTRPQRDNTAVMGSSMGGLVSLYMHWHYPNVFSKAACLSVSLFWKKCHVLKMIEQSRESPQDIKIYFDHGGVGKEGEHAEDFRRLRRILLQKGYREGVDFKYHFDKKGDHSERSWARRVRRPLLFLFGQMS